MSNVHSLHNAQRSVQIRALFCLLSISPRLSRRAAVLFCRFHFVADERPFLHSSSITNKELARVTRGRLGHRFIVGNDKILIRSQTIPAKGADFCVAAEQYELETVLERLLVRSEWTIKRQQNRRNNYLRLSCCAVVPVRAGRKGHTG